MSLIKFAILGAAVAYGINELTKKRDSGRSIMDDLTERSPEFIDKARGYAAQAIDHFSGSLKERPT